MKYLQTYFDRFPGIERVERGDDSFTLYFYKVGTKIAMQPIVVTKELCEAIISRPASETPEELNYIETMCYRGCASYLEGLSQEGNI